MKSVNYFKCCMVFFFLLTLNSNLIGGEVKYAVNAIPDSLKLSANAVIRDKNIVFHLKDIDKAELKVAYAITILNNAGLQHAYLTEYYNKFLRINKIKATVYDKNGVFVKRIKSEDIQDRSVSGAGMLFSDTRMKIIDPEYLKLPFTIEYSYEIDYNGLLDYPDWFVYDSYNVSTEHAKFSLKKPGHLNVRILEHEFSNKPTEIYEDQQHITSWEINGIKAIKEELFSKPLSEKSPFIQIAPVEFEIDGFYGNCQTWESFGNWINKLNEGKTNLPEESKQKFREMVSNAESEREKCKILYEYLQDNTRYINISIGIGGWQPIDAETVDKVSYGDCKALTNYMKSLLEVAGIESYYTLVRAGDNAPGIIKDFPSQQFNHAILCALVDTDTVWLECTSQRIPFGYLGTFTDDRDVLLINENGGALVRTCQYTQQINKQLCDATIYLNEYGSARGYISNQFMGSFYYENWAKILADDYDKKKLIREGLHLPDFRLVDFTIEERKTKTPTLNENIELTMNGCGTNFGNKIFIKLNLLNKTLKIPKKDLEERGSDILIRRGYIKKDSITYILPENYKVEKVSKNKEIISEFGQLNTYVYQQDSLIHYVRTLKINKGEFPVEDYEKFVAFYKSVKKADDDRAVLVSK